MLSNALAKSCQKMCDMKKSMSSTHDEGKNLLIFWVPICSPPCGVWPLFMPSNEVESCCNLIRRWVRRLLPYGLQRTVRTKTGERLVIWTNGPRVFRWYIIWEVQKMVGRCYLDRSTIAITWSIKVRPASLYEIFIFNK